MWVLHLPSFFLPSFHFLLPSWLPLPSFSSLIFSSIIYCLIKHQKSAWNEYRPLDCCRLLSCYPRRWLPHSYPASLLWVGKVTGLTSVPTGDLWSPWPTSTTNLPIPPASQDFHCEGWANPGPSTLAPTALISVKVAASCRLCGSGTSVFGFCVSRLVRNNPVKAAELGPSLGSCNHQHPSMDLVFIMGVLVVI